MSLLAGLRSWEFASLVSFTYTLVVALVRPGLERRIRFQVSGGAAAGVLFTAASARAPFHPVLHEWLLPPSLLVLSYWTTGLLFVAPMPRIEKLFAQLDRALRVRELGSIVPPGVAGLLEFFYAAVYACVPIALVLHLALAASPNPDRFWAVILVTDFICFAALPWIQTRPPRSVEAGEPWSSSLRNFNLRLLDAGSIRVNTFPSGHAAEALAAALLVSNLHGGIFIWMLFNAAAVSAGAVYGRYHYAIDAVAGWVVAVAVWVWLSP